MLGSYRELAMMRYQHCPLAECTSELQVEQPLWFVDRAVKPRYRLESVTNDLLYVF